MSYQNTWVLPAAIYVVPRVTNEGDLVEDGLVNAEVGRHVAGLVATMEHLALGFLVGVEAGLGLGAARETGRGNGVVHGIAGIAGSNQRVHFGSRQSRLRKKVYQ